MSKAIDSILDIEKYGYCWDNISIMQQYCRMLKDNLKNLAKSKEQNEPYKCYIQLSIEEIDHAIKNFKDLKRDIRKL